MCACFVEDEIAVQLHSCGGYAVATDLVQDLQALEKVDEVRWLPDISFAICFRNRRLAISTQSTSFSWLIHVLLQTD